MRKLLVLFLLTLVSCSGSDWFLHKGPFFEMTIPPGFVQTEKNDNVVRFEGDSGKISVSWSKDQYSVKDNPATEVVTGQPGDKVTVSEPQILGKNKIWYSEIEGKEGYSVYLSLPLDRGELRIEAFSSANPIDIRQSARSVTITDETYFSYPR
jgi:hypothetical protein